MELRLADRTNRARSASWSRRTRRSIAKLFGKERVHRRSLRAGAPAGIHVVP